MNRVLVEVGFLIPWNQGNGALINYIILIINESVPIAKKIAIFDANIASKTQFIHFKDDMRHPTILTSIGSIDDVIHPTIVNLIGFVFFFFFLREIVEKLLFFLMFNN